jgi:hypothetical protein
MKARRALSGDALSLLLVGGSILDGIALTIACSYGRIALWWVMVGCSAINVLRLGVRLSRASGADRPDAARTSFVSPGSASSSAIVRRLVMPDGAR